MSSSRPIGLTPKQFGATNALVTLAAMSFLVWVVYFHEGDGGASRAASLPLINAILNGTSGVLISLGLWAIRQRKRTLHMQLMFAQRSRRRRCFWSITSTITFRTGIRTSWARASSDPSTSRYSSPTCCFPW